MATPSCRGPASPTAGPEATARYRLAAGAASEPIELVVTHLRDAVRLDHGFVVAAADLAALAGRPITWTLSRTALARWERQHLEILTAVHEGRPERAETLLREQLSEHGCDPLAVLVLRRRGHLRTPLHDLAVRPGVCATCCTL